MILLKNLVEIVLTLQQYQQNHQWVHIDFPWFTSLLISGYIAWIFNNRQNPIVWNQHHWDASIIHLNSFVSWDNYPISYSAPRPRFFKSFSFIGLWSSRNNKGCATSVFVISG